MVIMDALDGRTLQEILDDKPDDKDLKNKNPDKGPHVMDGDLVSLDDALTLLSKHGLVHGNICPPNVMLCLELNGGLKAYLLDFDWAGKDGEVLYSDNLNNTILWPRDVEDMPDTLITASDDANMWLNLFNQPMVAGVTPNPPPASATSQLSPAT